MAGSPQLIVLPWVRIVILLTAVAVLCGVSFAFTGTLIPQDAKHALIFQNALLLVVLGSAVIEHKFTKPADSFVNALMGLITLIGVFSVAPKLSWWGVATYCLAVLVLAGICIAVSSGPMLSGWRAAVARFTYAPSVFFGKARVLYSIMFLFGIFSFYGTQASETLALLLFWGAFVVIWPLGVPEFLSGVRVRLPVHRPIGKVVRTDWPNLVRVALTTDSNWSQSSPKLYEQPDGNQCMVIPLYAQVQEEQLLGTGLCVAFDGEKVPGLDAGFIYEGFGVPGVTKENITRQLGGSETSRLIGFVVEDSTISQVRFETWAPDVCREGMLISCQVGAARVYYQVTGGLTREESLESDRHGFQVAIAVQLGVPDPEKGFAKHSWLPPMNTPVFKEPEDFGRDSPVSDGDFVFGRIPGTEMRVGGPFVKFMDHHTAVLGVTGSGKTELAFDLIRHALANGLRVVCIDLTARYIDRLKDIDHENLSISDKLSEELSEKLFEVETGQYGAGKEKQALKQFAERLRGDVDKSIRDFLIQSEGPRLGILTLDEISNTKATLYITELYLTCLLHFARDCPSTCPRVLIVVEEAHTVMPEPATMGLADYESRGLVSKIAQIALQGRKYGVGLLVIAQRTATVSKSVLTQCNTMITLSCFDETSLGFLNNFYGEVHTRIVPALPRLHAIIFGKAVRSERPIIVEIPYDAAKAQIDT